ncbi:TetR/AcrR family transcriptional regulator [uncultured Kriegella sp.]|uniref:TetR/AcrR family transcriptional regulator n=1 Tax=uncultured Kriegella sp. TaxID=1798910 RepID=UPI0030D7E924|tara:strand:+ start:56863 stop:57456 length:594 start_codon:yes stop_codon:yes gene_type:complete
MNESYVNSGRTNQKLETRSKILVSAQYFLNNGLEFNLEDIAKRTKISRATVYRYFPNVDILAAEAALDIIPKSPEIICKNLKGTSMEDKALEIQDYYNTLVIDHEKLFRKYLSTVLDLNISTPKRGARRKKTLQLLFEQTNFTNKEKEDLSNLFTILMGIEPLVVTKDVCGLNNKESIELMKWGIKLLCIGFMDSRK